MTDPNVQPPVEPAPHTRRAFYRHYLRASGLSGALIVVSLALGVLGYHFIAKLNWVDSILNASMILTGMGPVSALTTNAAKLFASAYALFSGLIFITATGILIAPIFHLVLHRFHVEGRNLR